MSKFCAVKRAGLLSAMLFVAAPVLAQDEADDAGVEPIVKSLPSEIMPLTPSSLLLDIVDTGRHLIAVGDRGAVIVSNDGATWAQVPTPTRAPLTAVDFADADHGWAVGHDAVILHTADGGRTWELQNFEPELEMPLLDVLFLDTQRGFAVGAYGLFYRTTDGGTTWEEVDSPIREDEWHFNAITRLADGTLFIAGESGTLAMSTDEGQTWETITSPYDSSLFGALPYGEKGVVIFGLRGNVFVSDDAASAQWREVDTGTVASMFGGTVLDDGRKVMVGVNGNIIVSANGVEDVQVLKSAAGTALSAAIAVDGVLLAVGESGVQRIALN
ncbi:WD40/YVTN/BNR-like repeat-containing protein [Sinimarinibacterium thermocellulolyticum]|uniref:YCF48-related protein n=1 Tax=Sinimarinibacterium thermocellulolyticum TaxID=3170016 RepID=A0ABV2A970_9GAMM